MPTALELPREQWNRYLEPARHRSLPPELTPAERSARERLLTHVRVAAAALKRTLGVRRVILFGSLANTHWFKTDSDVDIAIEGLAKDAFWEAWRLLEDSIHDRPVDMVEIETASESLRRAIQRYGIEL